MPQETNPMAAAVAASKRALAKKKAKEEAAAAEAGTPVEGETQEAKKPKEYGMDDLKSEPDKVDIKRENYQSYAEYMKAVKGEEARVKREAEAQKKALK